MIKNTFKLSRTAFKLNYSDFTVVTCYFEEEMMLFSTIFHFWLIRIFSKKSPKSYLLPQFLDFLRFKNSCVYLSGMRRTPSFYFKKFEQEVA